MTIVSPSPPRTSPGCADARGAAPTGTAAPSVCSILVSIADVSSRSQGQRLHWHTHQKYCKTFGQYITSPRYSQLGDHEKLDAVLLTHLLAEIAASHQENDTELATFLSLLPGPVPAEMCPPTCPLKTRRSPTVPVSDLYIRCGNNNFSIHSHFTTVAHGVFPLASRLFNHSCRPNAIPKYRFTQAEDVKIAIVAIRDIAAGEEVSPMQLAAGVHVVDDLTQICIPYVDCVLLETRQHMFRYSYGFTCTCVSCVALDNLRTRKPVTPVASSALSAALRDYVFPAGTPDSAVIGLPEIDLAALPAQLHGILSESFLAMLCESFRNASHDGPWDLALETGLTVLSFYLLIYPPTYPQIGESVCSQKDSRRAVISRYAPLRNGEDRVERLRHL